MYLLSLWSLTLSLTYSLSLSLSPSLYCSNVCRWVWMEWTWVCVCWPWVTGRPSPSLLPVPCPPWPRPPLTSSASSTSDSTVDDSSLFRLTWYSSVYYCNTFWATKASISHLESLTTLIISMYSACHIENPAFRYVIIDFLCSSISTFLQEEV